MYEVPNQEEISIPVLLLLKI
jgi:hypothetical protein